MLSLFLLFPTRSCNRNLLFSFGKREGIVRAIELQVCTRKETGDADQGCRVQEYSGNLW